GPSEESYPPAGAGPGAMQRTRRNSCPPPAHQLTILAAARALRALHVAARHEPATKQPAAARSAHPCRVLASPKHGAHARPPRMSCLFSISIRSTIANATMFITIADPP